MFFPVRLASVQSHAAPARGMCDDSQNVFLLTPGCWTRPTREEEDDSWQMHHSRWLPVLLEDSAEGWCSSSHGKHLSQGPEACLALKSRVKAPFILTLPLFNLKLVSRGLWWRAARWAHVSSHGNGCSAHCSRKVRQFSGFIFSLYRSRPLAWHDPQIIWMPENPKPALYSFFVFYVPFLLGVEANKRRSFARVACLLGRFKKINAILIPVCNYFTFRSKFWGQCLAFHSSSGT